MIVVVFLFLVCACVCVYVFIFFEKKSCFRFLAETVLISSWNHIFSGLEFIELFIKINPSIIKIDCWTEYLGKNCSAVSSLLQAKNGIQ